MDPNAALTAIRSAIADYDEASEHDALAAGALVEAFQGLDQWLTNGGFLPDVWQATRSR